MSNFCEKRHRKKFLENFGEFITQERHIRISICSAHCLYIELNWTSECHPTVWELM